jgi:thymidylate synthase
MENRTQYDEEHQYLAALREIQREGWTVPDRTGVGIKMLPGLSFKYDLTSNKLPIWNTRKINWKNQFIELIWFLNGRTDVKYLQERGVKIWDSWVKPNGTIGPGYGKQWRSWDRMVEETYQGGNNQVASYHYNRPIDQFANLIAGLKTNPFSRRHIVTLWNPADMDECVLPCCHGDIIQFVVDSNKGLHTMQYQRSADMPLGYCPWQYAMLTRIVADLTGLTPASFTATIGNAHIYDNQKDAVAEQLGRSVDYVSPATTFHLLKPITTIADVCSLEITDVEVKNYNPKPFIKFPIAV